MCKPATKIAASFETAKRNLLKDVKGFEKVRFGCSNGFVELDTPKGPQYYHLREVKEMRALHCPKSHQQIPHGLATICHIGLPGQNHLGNIDTFIGLGNLL